ncbi:glycoside hydrolase family 95 protein [Pelagibacterium limicola]|uniref:glycoside hydrolase family 95 protein n=1 Tax=Pelagibacterium limicola TaxID=2791022 RepID=UPI0018AFEA4A|nr:glycoside hydrolase family 95 protein [Pelagibacterium limicola]
MSDLELWYDHPAAEWTQALPVGNGRLGAMIFGGAAHDRLQLNEDTLWTGGPYSPVNPEAREHLDEVRRMLFENRFTEAEALAERHLMARPVKQMSYQPAGDLWIDQPGAGAAQNYRRSLDLETATAQTRFSVGGVNYTREIYATAADGVIVLHMTADRPGSISAGFSLTSGQPGAARPATADTLSWSGTNRSAHGIEGRIRLRLGAKILASGGSVTLEGPVIRVDSADEVLVLLDAATSFRRFDDVSGDPDIAVERRLDAAARKSAAALKSSHIADYRSLFDRFGIALGDSPAANMPTDTRLAANTQSPDPALAALYIQYARYLMIASSRPGTQAANLQGVWNDLVDPPWGSKYTANINLQMNYWLADLANLGECLEPLLRLAEEASVTGAEMAAAHYGARGWVLHHNTDIWRATGPIDGPQWGLWPMGAAWICVQLWDHAVFAGRPDALVRRVYPLIAGAVRFLLDTLVVLPGTDFLVTNPSVSPENIHPYGTSLCAGPAMDRQLARDLFDALEAAAGQLGIEDSLVAEALQARTRIPPDRIGHAGQLQEWLEDWDMQAPEMDHRHVSHLYGLYPSLQISLSGTPEYAAAARRSLEVRGDEATGWGIAWRINLWARLQEGERAQSVVQMLLSPQRTYPNLFDAHPPFQIDGNFGGAAGILEMLVQSDGRTVQLLPALPSAWPRGRLTGVRCRGGIVADLEWHDGRIVSAKLMSRTGQSVTVRYRDETTTAHLPAGLWWTYPISA